MIHWVRRMRAFWAGLWARLFRRVRVDYIGSAVPLPPPLKPEEERALVEAIEAGDSSAKGTLIEHNLRLVVYIARKFENTGIGMEDLISTGTIGLIKAVNTFDGSKKIKLATYASRCIENEILMHLRKTSRMRYEVSIDEPLNVDWDGCSAIFWARSRISWQSRWRRKRISRFCAMRWCSCPRGISASSSCGLAFRLGRSVRKSRWRTSWGYLNRISPDWKNAFCRA